VVEDVKLLAFLLRPDRHNRTVVVMSGMISRCCGARSSSALHIILKLLAESSVNLCCRQVGCIADVRNELGKGDYIAVDVIKVTYTNGSSC
jgi:hypothetical protein